MLTTLPLEPLFRRDLWMQYKRRGGWNKQAAGLTNQANFSSGKNAYLSLSRIGFWTENVHFKSCQKLACASWSIFFSAVAVRILERRPELKLLESLLNRQTKAKLLTRRQNLTNSANRNLKEARRKQGKRLLGAIEERGGQSVEYTEALQHHLTTKPSRIVQHTSATSWQRSQNYEDSSKHFIL